MSEALGTRQAALLLYGLAPSERDQVLARLSEAETSRLRPLLQELAALGIPPAHAATLSRTAVVEPGRTSIERAGQLAPEAVLAALQSCSPATAALLLQAAAWPWKSEVIRLRPNAPWLASKQRTPPTRAVLAVLCECLCSEAADAPGMFTWTR